MTSAWMEDSNPSSSTGDIHTTTLPSPNHDRKKKQQQQQRQLLSCTKCRARKIKCDRTKPCSACCARGLPKECHFVVAEGADYGPIQQSYRLKKLEAENKRLKERLRSGQFDVSEEGYRASALSSPDCGTPSRSPFKAGSRPSSSRQKKFRCQDPTDSLYFGSPGFASIISDFADMQIGAQSLTHTMPRGADIFAPQNGIQSYPFATMWLAALECIPALLGCLPPQQELFGYLDAFQTRVQTCSFPHTPEEITRKEVEHFLADAKNAEVYPDRLALIFAALALGAQAGVFDKHGGRWVEDAMAAECSKADVYIAAAMQALRMASFMNRPTLNGIQTLIMIGPYLTNSGRFLDAWTLFGTTIRLAQSTGLHRNPKYLDPTPPARECAIRQTLWWWMLHMDQQYSMTLGRPLGISGIGDCPPPEPLTSDPTIMRLGEFINQFTVLARQILSSDRLTNAKIDRFTDELSALWDTMPEMLQFNQSWLDPAKDIPEWPLDAMAAVFYAEIHSYITLLNRQRISNTLNSTLLSPPNMHPHTHSQPHPHPHPHPPPHPSITFSPATAFPTVNHSFPSDAPSGPPRGRDLVLSSSLALITAFLFFYSRVPAALINWAMGQQAFNASMLLLLDALETNDLRHIGRVEQAYAVFVELEQNAVHRIAGLAVERVSWGLDVLRKRAMGQQQELDEKGRAARPAGIDDAVMGNTGMFLLEDTGLQGFVPDGFAPLRWDMTSGPEIHSSPTPRKPSSSSSSTTSTHPYQQRQGTTLSFDSATSAFTSPSTSFSSTPGTTFTSPTASFDASATSTPTAPPLHPQAQRQAVSLSFDSSLLAHAPPQPPPPALMQQKMPVAVMGNGHHGIVPLPGQFRHQQHPFAPQGNAAVSAWRRNSSFH